MTYSIVCFHVEMVSILDGRLSRSLVILTYAFLGNHQPSKTEIMFPVNNVEVT